MAYERNDRRYGGGDRPGSDQDRGFFERAGDEVRSWFGDDEAERRRRVDERYDERFDRGGGERATRERSGGYERGGRYARSDIGGYRPPEQYPRWYRSNHDDDFRRGATGGGYAGYDQDVEEGRQFDNRRGSSGRDDGDYAAGGYGRGGGETRHDPRGYGERGRSSSGSGETRYGYPASGRSGDHDDYTGWRDRQISSFDRDYDEYRRENRSRFESEFATWRQNRQTQRDSLTSVKEHQEVVGSDGTHVGKVDHVRGDHILLTKTDRDAGGHHHTIPSSWIASVDDKVHLSKTAADAQAAWKDVENQGGAFGDDRNRGRDEGRTSDRGGGGLNRSFSGTY